MELKSFLAATGPSIDPKTNWAMSLHSVGIFHCSATEVSMMGLKCCKLAPNPRDSRPTQTETFNLVIYWTERLQLAFEFNLRNH